MILTIFRHGEAGPASSDRQRELTTRGRGQLHIAARVFLRQCERRELPLPELIRYSAWLRTTQTAQLLAAAIPTADLEPEEVLQPGFGAARVAEALAEGNGPAHLLLVSHQPLVSSLADYLLGDPGRVAPLLPGAFVTLSLAFIGAAGAELVCSAQPPGYEVQA